MKRSIGLRLSLFSLSCLGLALLAPAGVGAEDPKPAAGTPSGSRSTVTIPDGAAAFDGHHYQLYDEVEELSWTGAKESCASLGGYLVVIQTAEEAEFVAELCDDRYMYLGASDKEKEGDWSWVDGSKFRYTRWLEGQPNDYGGTEDYLATYEGGDWVDVDHDGGDFWMPTGYICEWGE